MLKLSAVRKGALVGLLAGAPLLVSGCAMSGQSAQIVQTVVGILGAAMGMGGGPLQGPVAGALPVGPFAPGGTVPGGAAPAPAPFPGAPAGPAAPGGQPNDVASRIAQAAYNLPNPFPYKPGTDNGNLGCADVVSHALVQAGAMSPGEHDLAVAGVSAKLKAKGWQSSQTPQHGDVVVWGKLPGGSHKHIGIIVVENGAVYAINNSSSQKKPVKVLLSSMNRDVEEFIRNPGSVNS